MIEQLQAAVDAAQATLDAAAEHVAKCEATQKRCEAEFAEAEKLAPKLTQTDLAREMQRDTQARRAGLI